MKKIITLLFIACLFMACGGDDDPQEGTKDNSISFNFSAKAIPSGSNNLIGVQINKEDGTPYAYGLFDDFSKIKIDLPKGSKYLVKSTIVVDGKSKIAQNSEGYLKPFIITGDKGVAVTNSFTVTGNTKFLQIDKSTSTLVDGNSPKSTKAVSDTKDYEVPQLDRFYGESTTYDPNSDVAPVVDMRRQIFGIKFHIDYTLSRNFDLLDRIYAYVEGAPDTLNIYFKSDVRSVEAMYTVSDFTKGTPPSIKTSYGIYWESGKHWRISSGIIDIAKNALLDHYMNVISDADGGDSFPNKVIWNYWYYEPEPIQ